MKRPPAAPPQPQGPGLRKQGQRFRHEFERLQSALAREDATVELRRDPFGIAPERALVFVTATPITNFLRAAEQVGLEVLSESDYDGDFEQDYFNDFTGPTSPTLYATMPTQETFDQLLRLWQKYQAREQAEHGYTPWFNLFGMLVELRPWGPKDRLSFDNQVELRNRLPFDLREEVRLELEHWPTKDQEKLNQWRLETENKVLALGGRIIDRSSIHEGIFSYDAILVGLAAGTVRDLIDDPTAPEGLATLDGLQFILPQSIAQSLPSETQSSDANRSDLEEFDPENPFRVLLLDGTPVARHPILDGGVAIEDVHNLVDRSIVSNRRHATEMASLVLRGDLGSDGKPVRDSRILSIPLLIDNENNATSPNDRLFVDLVHTALHRAFGGEEPVAPLAFVVNFSIGVRGSNFSDRISSLARLLDWWSSKAGILFVVSAGNVEFDLHISDIAIGEFRDLPLAQRQALVRDAQQQRRFERTMLAPGEALNVLTVGAASLDLSPKPMPAAPNSIDIYSEEDALPAINSGIGLGPFRTIKPDLISAGGHHEIRAIPAGNDLRLQTAHTSTRSGLIVATAPSGFGSPLETRSRGTSCAAALVTRSLLNTAAALTDDGGPFAGLELDRTDLALLTRALAINASRWPNSAFELYRAEVTAAKKHYIRAAEEVTRYFGYGYMDANLMQEAPLQGVTLVGVGRIQKDGGMIFDVPLPPSLSGDMIHRNMLVTITWFSPVNPTRAKYRLASLEAIAADGTEFYNDEKDNDWYLAMKTEPPASSLIKRGTVWSRRLAHKRVRAPEFNDGAKLPIRVQCHDASRGGLDPDLEIPFAVVVTLLVSTTAEYDIYEEVRDQLLIRLQSFH